jgi:hypothetical protein
VLVHRYLFPLSEGKQHLKDYALIYRPTNLQGHFETGMDLWNRAMGMRFTIKYSKNPEILVQTFKAYNKRTMVRYKSNSSPRLLH